MLTILKLIGVLLALAGAAEVVIADSVKNKFYNKMVNADRRGFARYISSNALDIYQYLFAPQFTTLRFFLRSIAYSFAVLILSLVFLYIWFPPTFLQATSYIRALPVADSNLAYASIVLVFLTFVISDYICNGQTRFFLELMKNSKSLSRVLVLGYADLLVTASLAMVATSLAGCAFLYVESQRTYHIKGATIEFSEPVNLDAPGYITMSITTPPSKLQEYLYFKERDVSDVMRKDVFGNRYTTEETELGLNLSLLDSNERVLDRGYLPKLPSHSYQFYSTTNYETFCRSLNEMNSGEEFTWFDVKGWDSERVVEACLDRKPLQLDITYRWKDVFDYGYIAANLAGGMVWISAQSLGNGFSLYFGDSAGEFVYSPSAIKYEYRRTEYHAYDMKKTLFDKVVFMVWLAQHGLNQMLEPMGLPWSSFFVVTLLTSAFIWIVVLVHIFTYPLAVFAESHWSQESVFKIEEKPFLCMALLISVYLIAAGLVFT